MEFNLYNVNINLWGVSMYILEFLTTGGTLFTGGIQRSLKNASMLLGRFFNVVCPFEKLSKSHWFTKGKEMSVCFFFFFFLYFCWIEII